MREPDYLPRQRVERVAKNLPTMNSGEQRPAVGCLHERSLWQESERLPGSVAQRDDLVKELLILRSDIDQLNL
jgi:hypothetical protein